MKDEILARINAIMDTTDIKSKANIKARGLAITLLLGNISVPEALEKIEKIEKNLKGGKK